MAHKNILSGLLLFGTFPCPAQNQNAVWLFTITTGVDFATPPPVVLHDYTGYGHNTSVISDEAGQLALFSDDTRIWNAENQVLVNGDGLHNNPFTNTPQSSMFLPWPGHPGQYYMVQPYPWNVNDMDSRTFYHRIDISAGGGGEVIEKNIVLADSAGAYMTAVLDSAGTGIWVILHHVLEPSFLAYHLDASGLSTSPVISVAGPPIEQTWYRSLGILRPSPHGERLYLSKCHEDCVNYTSLSVMDFDRTTGEVSEFSTFEGSISAVNGMEVSPSGEFLYAATYVCDSGIATRLWQYDISSGDPATIHDSKTLVYEAPITPGGCQGMQGNLALAVDGRIYCGISNAQYLGVINHPDLPSPACEYVHQGLYLEGDTSWLSLPNLMREYPITNTGMFGGPSVVDRLLIQPNPARDGCGIILTGNGIRSLVLQDGIGRLALVVPCASAQREVRIERAGLASGIYQVIARNGEGGTVAAGRVVFE